MADDIFNNLFSANQDLFRSTVEAIDDESKLKIFKWLNYEGPFPYPKSIHLNLTLRCTAKCNNCKQWTWPDHKEFSPDQLSQLFQTFKSWGVQSVTFGGGNPLLYEHVILALKLAHEANIEIGIITEGINLSEDLAFAISKYANWIRFSLDGPNANIHDRLRNTLGLFNQVMANIARLKNSESQLLIGINCVIQKGNILWLSEMVELAERIGINTLSFKVPHGKYLAGITIPSQSEWDEVIRWAQSAAENGNQLVTNIKTLNSLMETVFLKDDLTLGTPVSTFYVKESIHCFAPFLFLTCDSEGNIFPCDYLQADTRPWKGHYGAMRSEFCLGNILEDSQKVLTNLANAMRNRIHNLPASGYEECGCCTRFCQLNSTFTHLNKQFNLGQILEFSTKSNDLLFL